jgi:hypothetical protein
MHFFKFLIVLLSVYIFAHSLYAAGNFYIGEDAGGVYFQTDGHGGWYIDEQDLKKFIIGENGRYYIKTDRNGTYIKTDRNRKFYLDLEAKKQLKNEAAAFNREQEKRWKKLRSDKAQRKELKAPDEENEKINQEDIEDSKIQITVSHKYHYPYGIWYSPYRYSQDGTVIHHKNKRPKWINRPDIKEHHIRKRSALRHHGDTRHLNQMSYPRLP